MAGEAAIKVKLLLDKQDAKEIETDLDKRLGKVSSKFGSAMRRGLRNLGLSTIVAGAFGAIFNNIGNLNQEIDNTLEKYKDITGKATAQGLTTGEYFKLNELFKLAGVESFDSMFEAFRTKLNQANRGVPSILSAYKGQQASPETFLRVLSALQKMVPAQRSVYAKELFGSDADVTRLVTTDLNALAARAFKGVDTEELTQAIGRGRLLSQEQMTLALRREVDNLRTRAGLITTGTLSQQDQFRRSEQALVNQTIPQYANAAQLQIKTLEAQTKIVEYTGKTVNVLQNMWNELKAINQVEKEVRAGRLTREEANARIDELTGVNIFD